MGLVDGRHRGRQPSPDSTLAVGSALSSYCAATWLVARALFKLSPVAAGDACGIAARDAEQHSTPDYRLHAEHVDRVTDARG